MTEYTIADRLGHTGLVCQKCNARNPKDAEYCRKCGNDGLREKNSIDKYE